MGGLLIKNQELRCKDCFKLYSLRINPEFPISKIDKICKCSTKTMEIVTFLSEYKKNKNLSISCSKCNKTSPKDPRYCHECQKLYCINCCKSLHNEENNKDHKQIVIEKYDFFCIFHQNENFCGYCKNCKLDICSKCDKEKLHEGHKILFFNKIYDEKKMREYLRKATKLAELKLEYNKKVCNMIKKEIKKNEIIKDLKTLIEISEDENKKILEIINIIYEIYDMSKPKNYCIIMNMVNNINFNLERIKFEKNTSKEKDAEALIKYLKTDFILVSKTKKEVPTTLEEQFFNDKFNVQFEDEHKEDNENKGGDGEQKEEGENEKKEEEIEEDDGKEKTMNQKLKIIEKKMNDKGGFKQVVAGPSNSAKNDIISAPNSDVISIISSQTINKKVKKKPRKINFQNE